MREEKDERKHALICVLHPSEPHPWEKIRETFVIKSQKQAQKEKNLSSLNSKTARHDIISFNLCVHLS